MDTTFHLQQCHPSLFVSEVTQPDGCSCLRNTLEMGHGPAGSAEIGPVNLPGQQVVSPLPVRRRTHIILVSRYTNDRHTRPQVTETRAAQQRTSNSSSMAISRVHRPSVAAFVTQVIQVGVSEYQCRAWEILASI